MVLVNAKVKESVVVYDSSLSKERQRVINYYNGVLPKATATRLLALTYLDRCHHDSVESMKAQLGRNVRSEP